MARSRRQQRRALRKAKADGRISRKESRSLRKLGISKRKAAPTGAKEKPAARKAEPKPERRTRPAARKADSKARPSRSNAKQRPKKEKPVLSVKQLNKLRTEIKSNEGGVVRQGYTGKPSANPSAQTTAIDFSNYGGKKNPFGGNGKGKNSKIWKSVAKELGIKKVDSQDDVNRLITYVDNYGTQKKDGEKKVKYGGRGSGKFSDITKALGEDAQQGLDKAEELRNKGVRGTRRRYEGTLADLRGLKEAGSPFGDLAIQARGEDSIALPDRERPGRNRRERDKSKGRKAEKDRPLNKRQQRRQDRETFGMDVDTKAPGVLAPDKNTKYTGDKRERQGNDRLDRLKDRNADLRMKYKELRNEFRDFKKQPVEPRVVNNNEELQALKDRLALQRETSMNELNDASDAFRSQINDLQLQIGDLGSLNDNFSAANELLQEQLNSANAAREDAERRATNLRSAFVPQANQFSTSFSYGDFRASERKKQNNQLSDLQMLGNGLGTPTNPLAGLQLS